jgi:pre-mRNA-splicing factor SYF1
MFYSKKNSTQYNYWMFLCQIIEKFPEIAKKFNVENIIRHGINKYSEEIGRLWVALANYFIKIKQFNKSREIFEEALEKVLTVRDFTLVFNTYLKFEEELAKSGIEDYDNENDGNGVNDNMNIDDSNIESSLKEAFIELKIKNEDGDLFEDNNSNNNNNLDDNEEMKLTYEEKLNFKFLRLNNLLERRPLMLCLTKLRQNPNNVKEWIQKISLCKNYDSIIETYEEAINTIIPEKAFGNLSELYINYANYYEQYNEIEKMNNIYFRACNVNYNKIHENIDMWCLWIEKQLNFRNYNDAYIIIKTVCTNKKYSRYNKSLILWSLYVDLESNFGNEENIRKIYDKMIELKIANIQTIFNYCSYLEKRNFFEETFRIFEQGIFYFQWPGLYDLWIVYIIKFINRYKGKKIERIRDMYEEVIKQCPKDKIKIFYYIFAYYEEEYGSFNHCINILDKGANDVPQNDKAFIYSILISKTSKYFGITKTRNFFNKAMDNLDKDHILEIGLKYISIESKLGELGRARSIFKHLSQFFNPTNEVLKEAFWDVWEQFEIIHGNSDTYYDMNVTKSQVKNQYSLNIPLLNFEKGE